MYETYLNRRNPHVTIHRIGCNQLRKRGGEHKFSQGNYQEHETFGAAERFANETGLKVIQCSFCKPTSEVK
jgi:hypothetical protein